MSMSVFGWVVEPIFMEPLLGVSDKLMSLLSWVLDFGDKSVPLLGG